MECTNETIYGPVAPAIISSKQEADRHNSSGNERICKVEEKQDDVYGPVLPPCLQGQGTISMGPFLPPHLREKLMNKVSGKDLEEESREDEDVYGPLLPGSELTSRSAIALEERALEMRLSQLNPEEQKKKREEWMIELPTVSASKLGLGPRQFKPNAGPDMSDRSSWTDIPNAKKKKQADSINLRKELEHSERRKRDNEQERIVKKHKREPHSLVELHQKKLKKDKVEGPKERTPFNRDTDLQVNRFDEAQKAAILKKAQLLDDRFSKGTTKYL